MADRKYNSANKKLDETQDYKFADLLQVQQPQQTQQPASPQTGAQAPGLDYSPLQSDSYGKPYSSYRDAQQQNGGQWYGMAQDLLEKYQNMPGFQFDLNGNGLYNLYKDMYTKQGQQAMRDTMGQAAGLTGGYASSYAQNVGQQAYNGYLEKLNAVVPDIYAKERSAYDQSRQDLLSQMQLLNQMGDRAYQQSRDRLSDDRYQQELAYQQSRDAIADARYNQEWNYNVANADRERAYNLAMQLIGIGKLPSDAQLAAAGMDKEAAQALAAWYAQQMAGIGSTGGGGGGGGGRTYSSYTSNPRDNDTPADTATPVSQKDALWSQIPQETQARILSWINGHPGRVSAGTLDEAFGADTVERQYMALIYGV